MAVFTPALTVPCPACGDPLGVQVVGRLAGVTVTLSGNLTADALVHVLRHERD